MEASGMGWCDAIFPNFLQIFQLKLLTLAISSQNKWIKANFIIRILWCLKQTPGSFWIVLRLQKNFQNFLKSGFCHEPRFYLWLSNFSKKTLYYSTIAAMGRVSSGPRTIICAHDTLKFWYLYLRFGIWEERKVSTVDWHLTKLRRSLQTQTKNHALKLGCHTLMVCVSLLSSENAENRHFKRHFI